MEISVQMEVLTEMPKVFDKPMNENFLKQAIPSAGGGVSKGPGPQ